MKWYDMADDLVDAIASDITATADGSQSERLDRWLDADRRNREQYEQMRDPATLRDRLARYGGYNAEEALVVVRSKMVVRRRGRAVLRRAIAVAACAAAVLTAIVLPEIGGGGSSAVEQALVGRANTPADISIVSQGQRVVIAHNAAIVMAGQTATVSAPDGQEAQRLDISGRNWHKLIVPRGRRSDIVLPDGSRVWVNAGSELEFPSRFSDTERRVRVSGEVFVEAAHDPSKPFFVETGDMTVRVLGTSFNVSSHADGRGSAVVLVEGSVEVAALGNRHAVAPGQMLALVDGAVSLSNVDTEPYVSWRDGYMMFADKVPLLSVLEKIEQYYDVSFSDSGREMLVDHTCSGKLKLFDDINIVLESLCQISGARYERQGETIYITSSKR
jgi:ferric-dicitrate binding protein FerR (iron transport regulator)